MSAAEPLLAALEANKARCFVHSAFGFGNATALIK